MCQSAQEVRRIRHRDDRKLGARAKIDAEYGMTRAEHDKGARIDGVGGKQVHPPRRYDDRREHEETGQDDRMTPPPFDRIPPDRLRAPVSVSRPLFDGGPDAA